jgi:N-acetylmuramoyl-L-alanine amidase
MLAAKVVLATKFFDFPRFCLFCPAQSWRSFYTIVVKKPLHNILYINARLCAIFLFKRVFFFRTTMASLMAIYRSATSNLMKNIKNLLFLLFFTYFQPAMAAPATDVVGVTVKNNTAIITLSLPDIAPNKVFIVPNPERLVVDVPAVKERPDVALPKSYRGKLIREVRFGQFTPETYRFVFDLTLPADVLDVQQDIKRNQLMITIAEADPQRKDSVSGSKSSSSSKATLAKDISKPAPKPKAKPLIVIDPGHGGVDPGTTGPHGGFEKDLVLTYAKALKTRLLKSGRYRVELTRDTDKFIMLRGRIKIARDKKADLFLSIHADSAPEASARGLSVYTLSEKASDQEAAALAARENKSDILAGIDLSEEREDVADILISLAQRDTTNRSSQLADLIVYSLDGKVRLLSNSHRYAGFAVLKAPDVPSVLIELGFLSHPQEEKQLKTSSYRQTVVDGIAKGVETYFAQCEQAEE